MQLKLAVAFSVLAVACADAPPDTKGSGVSAREVKDKVTDAAAAATRLAEQAREEYVQRAEAELAAVDQRIDALARQASALKAGAADAAKREYDETVSELVKRRDELAKQIREAKNSSGEAWQSLRSGVDKAMTELKKSAEEAADKFR